VVQYFIRAICVIRGGNFNKEVANLNTQEILQIALNLAGLKETPADSGVVVKGKNIKKVAFGVDIEVGELLLARELSVDAVITHHPKGGQPMVEFHNVMSNQIDRMVQAGVPINKAQKALQERVEQVSRSHHVANYDRVVSAAKLLKMPLLVIHTPADILAETFIQKHLDKNLNKIHKPKVQDVLETLLKLPEYKHTLAKPLVRVGKESDYAGRVFVAMAGGTSGGEKVAKAYFETGVGTLVVMHMPDDTIKAVKEQNIGNVVVAGHMASDSVGINQVIRAMEKKGLEVFKMSGVQEV
jgi:putative NIF3 family GTP cyclohydrolase 1 type 2